MPGAVVKMPDLLFVLHHVGRFSPLFVFHSDVVLDRLKILPMLKVTVEKINKQKCSQDLFFWCEHAVLICFESAALFTS